MRVYKCYFCGDEVKTKRTFGSKTAKFRCKNGHHFLVDKETPYEMKVVLPSAVNCPHTDKRSKGFGLCGTCYAAYKSATDPKFRERNKIRQKRYIENHPDSVFLARGKYDAKKLSLEAKKQLLNWLFELIEEEKSRQ